MRVVFDTNTVISALLFRGRMAWLVAHWQSKTIMISNSFNWQLRARPIFW